MKLSRSDRAQAAAGGGYHLPIGSAYLVLGDDAGGAGEVLKLYLLWQAAGDRRGGHHTHQHRRGLSPTGRDAEGAGGRTLQPATLEK